ncbi:hypothetical protein OG457_00155 [Streptomyces sp. NBC_01207]|nr:hypothetical protein OG457_00155 [Streptomyces sp. NBC_01207]
MAHRSRLSIEYGWEELSEVDVAMVQIRGIHFALYRLNTSLGPLGAAIQASVFITLATHPGLRAEADRLDTVDAALDDTVDAHDPRVEELAAQHCAHHKALLQAIEATGLDVAEEKLFEIYDSEANGEDDAQMSAFEAVTKMPYGFSPARTRCMELTARLLDGDLSAGS